MEANPRLALAPTRPTRILLLTAMMNLPRKDDPLSRIAMLG